MVIAGYRILEPILNAIQKQDTTLVVPIVAAQINWAMTALVIGGVIVALLGLNYWWNQKKRQDNINLTANKVLCEFGMKSGHAIWLLCEEVRGEIEVDDTEGKKKKFDSSVKAPVGIGNIGTYYTLEDHGYLVNYPFGKPPVQQTQIMMYHFNENISYPTFPRHPEQWDMDKYGVATAQLQSNSKDQSDMQAIMAEVSGAFKPLVASAKLIALIPQIRMFIFILMGLCVITAGLIFLTKGDVGVIKNFIIGVPVVTPK